MLAGLLAMALLLPGLVVSAQDAPAAFSGALTDATGRLLPNVPIVLVNTASGQTYKGQSDAAGRVAFAGVRSGEYQVEVRKSGFARRQGHVTLAPRQKLQRNLVLLLGSVVEMIVVSPDSAGSAAQQGLRRIPDRIPAADPCGQPAAAGCITPPVKLVDMTPRYPQAHAEGAVSGKVVVEARIGTEGRLKALQAAPDSDPAFVQATLEALRLWEFSPARVSGVPAECRIEVTAVFQIRRH